MADIREDTDRVFIKKAIKGFIITMIFLTFFSKTIYNFMIPTVSVTNPTSGELEIAISGEGKIEAKETYEFYMDKSLKVTDVNVKVGDLVNSGQVLMNVDTRELQRNLEDELITFEKKKVSIEKLSSNIDEKYNIDLRSLEDKIRQAEDELRINKELYKIGGESEANIKKSEINLNNIKREYQKVLLDKEREIEERKLNTKELELELKLQENKINSLKDDIENLGKMMAKMDGRIEEINFLEGTFTDSSKPLYKISDISKGYQVRIPLDIKKASYLNKEDVVEVVIRSIGENIEGKITDIIDNSNTQEEKRDEKEIIISLNSEKLVGGEIAEVNIKKKSLNYDLLVPNEAIREDYKGRFVLIVKTTEGPFGKEYYTQEIRLNIEDSDNSNTAVVGIIDIEDEIIVNSDRPISEKERIKVE
ncbi:RND family efflux transporter MFP subunit [Gottschalkia acidurici 9a]|uniref:RND family efflux transporter MFP subunit n=1 Tax=Gottschalkia acidurici (strain ATCC 7906 / DSM 604 / BCRC 14475 / CIP 104303 / KCTC 5404 / NCIMB 10678 / 9a) TaxID=1128398 RepID=K0B208_GOTA9|nr:efflux RND transporter periplasmic adaptor subunit [Gottschalkia acidurici]AFS78955.1 RND family efflux transporter MFP subunit [Gottschalkia acidurici 9a]